jgi:hypothetical protein
MLAISSSSTTIRFPSFWLDPPACCRRRGPPPLSQKSFGPPRCRRGGRAPSFRRAAAAAEVVRSLLPLALRSYPELQWSSTPPTPSTPSSCQAPPRRSQPSSSQALPHRSQPSSDFAPLSSALSASARAPSELHSCSARERRPPHSNPPSPHAVPRRIGASRRETSFN